jgi:flagellar biosynthesis protein
LTFFSAGPDDIIWHNPDARRNMEFQQKLKLAVALKYRTDEDVAPLVVATGRGQLAQALVKKALELDIPIHPDGELAELLSDVEVGHSIPEELYEVVAQIMAMVYRMDSALGRKLQD